ncbi:MAG TPA: hypothetical protein VGC86_03205, partial [Afipia sp.]
KTLRYGRVQIHLLLAVGCPMVKRSGVDVLAAASRGHSLPSPGLKEAPVLELMCSHFVLTLAAKQGPRFNVRRDLNGLLSLTGRHLVWPLPVLQRLREFLGRRCAGNRQPMDVFAFSTFDCVRPHWWANQCIACCG